MAQFPTEEVSRIAEGINREIPTADAVIRFDLYDAAKIRVVGNRNGFLRFGIELLKAAVVPANSITRGQISMDLSYLLHPSSEVYVDWFEVREDIERVPPSSWSERIWGVITIAWMVLAYFGLRRLGIFK